MSLKLFIIALAIILLIVFGTWLMTRDAAAPEVVDHSTVTPTTTATTDELPIEAHFTDADGRTVTVLFDNHADVAILTGLGYEALMLPRTISADGGRYEDEAAGIVLWNKGDEVTITEYDTEIFKGSESEVRE